MDTEQFKAVNLISDPIHGYIELTKRLTPEGAAATGHAQEDAAEEDLLDSPWLQRLRRMGGTAGSMICTAAWEERVVSASARTAVSSMAS